MAKFTNYWFLNKGGLQSLSTRVTHSVETNFTSALFPKHGYRPTHALREHRSHMAKLGIQRSFTRDNMNRPTMKP